MAPCRHEDAQDTAAFQVACGARHTLVLTQCGAAFATGWNCFGQLGIGAGERANRHTAVRVAGPWNPRGAQHTAKHACAAGASACEAHGSAQHGAGAEGGATAGPAGWASEGVPRGGSALNVGAAGCGAQGGTLPDSDCRDRQGQAEMDRGGLGLGDCVRTVHTLLGPGTEDKLQVTRVLDVVCGWWHSLFVVEFV